MVTYAEYAVEGPTIFGALGLRKMRYTGEHDARVIGPCTGHRYEWGTGRRLGYVDKRDMDALLGLCDQDGAALFEVAP